MHKSWNDRFGATAKAAVAFLMASTGRAACCGVTAWCLVAGAARLPAAERLKPTGQQIGVELKKSGDRAEVGKLKQGALVAVHSASGIGGATLIRPEGGWPQRVIVRLDLKGMESLRVESGGLWSEASLGGARRRPYWKTGQARNTEAAAAGHLEFPVTRSKGGVEIEIPREFLDTRAATIKLEWVDFFR